jgi:hypothetical protein
MDRYSAAGTPPSLRASRASTARGASPTGTRSDWTPPASCTLTHSSAGVCSATSSRSPFSPTESANAPSWKSTVSDSEKNAAPEAPSKSRTVIARKPCTGAPRRQRSRPGSARGPGLLGMSRGTGSGAWDLQPGGYHALRTGLTTPMDKPAESRGLPPPGARAPPTSATARRGARSRLAEDPRSNAPGARTPYG